MASGRIGNASGLNVFIDWSSTENSITANLYLYNQYRISTSVSKNWSLTINGNTKQGTISLGDKSAGTTTLIGSHTVSGLSPSSSYSISGSLAINLTSYNGSAVNTLSASGAGTTNATSTPQYPNITSFSVSNISGVDGLTKVRVNWSVDCTCDHAWYSLNGGSSWNDLPTTNIISGLSPNTSYNFKLKLKRADSQLTTASSTVTKSTYDIARINSLANFEHGNNPVVSITNPASISSLSLVMSVSNTQILSRTVSAGNNTITFSDTELDNLYKKYGSSSSLTATFVLSGSGYTNTKTCTITLKGNQKTMRTNVSGSWKRGKLWTNVNGTWKRGVLWTNVSGTWKRGI